MWLGSGRERERGREAHYSDASASGHVKACRPPQSLSTPGAMPSVPCRGGTGVITLL
jgi:hypothetical protein